MKSSPCEEIVQNSFKSRISTCCKHFKVTERISLARYFVQVFNKQNAGLLLSTQRDSLGFKSYYFAQLCVLQLYFSLNSSYFFVISRLTLVFKTSRTCFTFSTVDSVIRVSVILELLRTIVESVMVYTVLLMFLKIEKTCPQTNILISAYSHPDLQYCLFTYSYLVG